MDTPLGILGIVLTIIYSGLSATTFRYQRFTLNVARLMVADQKAAVGDISKLQAAMTPASLGVVQFLAYLVLTAAFVCFLVAIGWPWAGGLLVWAFLIEPLVLNIVWPFPTHTQCVKWALGEASDSMMRAHLAGDISAARTCSEIMIKVMTR